MTLGVGEVFAGYTVLRQLGGGGMGEVYLADHPRLPRQDALKILRGDISADESFRQRFVREADSVAALSHPNIVAVFDRGETDGQLWIATQYVAGTDAAQLLRTRYPAGMPADEVAAVVAGIGDALDYAHDRGLLHRDVKPANILLSDPDRTGRRRVFLADFGIARPLGDPSGLTATNFTLGTVAYAAPEQLMGADIDGRADQYALAATAFHLLTGRPPFEDTNPVAVISKHLTLPPPQVGPVRPELAGLDPVLSKAMAKDPAQRYPDCASFARDLARLIPTSTVGPNDATQQAVPVPAPPLANRPLPPTAQAPVPQLPPSAAETVLPQGKPARKKRASIVAAVMAAAVLLGGIGIGFQLQRNRNHYYVGVEGDGRVAIWHGVDLFASRPYALGCINNRGEVSQIRYDDDHSGCDFLRLEDLKPDKRPQVTAGLPGGGLDRASSQWRDLTTQSLLPLCRPLGTTTGGASQTPGTDCRGSTAPPTPAPPMKLTEHVTDLAGVLDRAGLDQVQGALGDLSLRQGVRLWVVYVTEFAGASGTEAISAIDWAKQTTELSGMAANDAILAVATQSRGYTFLVSRQAAGRGGAAEIDSLRINNIEPALRNEQWAAAAVAAAQGLAELNR